MKHYIAFDTFFMRNKMNRIAKEMSDKQLVILDFYVKRMQGCPRLISYITITFANLQEGNLWF